MDDAYKKLMQEEKQNYYEHIIKKMMNRNEIEYKELNNGICNKR